jgi:methylase of polypeptide subunit release factors
MTSTAATTPHPRTPPPRALQPRTARVGTLAIAYDDRVLQPRPWTAAHAAWAAEVLDEAPPGPVLELFCGAGHIGLLAVLDSRRRLVAVDVDPVACGYARINADAAGFGDRVEIRTADLSTALAGDELFPVVIADPPWVPTAETERYPEDPLVAIDGGPDGLELARRSLEVARRHLAPAGLMLLQLGSLEEAEEVRRLAGPDLVVTEVRQPDPTGVVVCVRAVDLPGRPGLG